nr:translation initiation factor IF-2-like [Aegilops tauschii subsp. strangulata]
MCGGAPLEAPSARRLLPPPPDFSTPSPKVESDRAPGSPSPSYEVEPATTPRATPVTGSTSSSPIPSSAAGSAGTAAAAAPIADAVAPVAAAAPVSAAGVPAAAAPAPAVGPAAPPLGVMTRARAGVLRPSMRYSSDEYVRTASTSTPSPIPTSARAAFGIPTG